MNKILIIRDVNQKLVNYGFWDAISELNEFDMSQMSIVLNEKIYESGYPDIDLFKDVTVITQTLKSSLVKTIENINDLSNKNEYFFVNTTPIDTANEVILIDLKFNSNKENKLIDNKFSILTSENYDVTELINQYKFKVTKFIKK